MARGRPIGTLGPARICRYRLRRLRVRAQGLVQLGNAARVKAIAGEQL